MKGLKKLPLFALVIVGLWSATALAGEADGCDTIDWKQQILMSFEGIEDACQEIVYRGDTQLVRFKVKFVRALPNGDVDVKMYLRDGTRVDRTFNAPEDFQADSDSGKTHFHMRDLTPGDVLDVYIPLSRVVVSHSE